MKLWPFEVYGTRRFITLFTKLAIRSCPEAVATSPHPSILFFKIYFNITTPPPMKLRLIQAYTVSHNEDTFCLRFEVYRAMMIRT